MIKLELNKMQNAIQKAKQLRPRVRMIGERLYAVSGSKGNTYRVGFAVAKDAKGNRVKLGECNCKAGQAGMMCYHVASAAQANVIIQGMRRQAAAA